MVIPTYRTEIPKKRYLKVSVRLCDEISWNCIYKFHAGINAFEMAGLKEAQVFPGKIRNENDMSNKLKEIDRNLPTSSSHVCIMLKGIIEIHVVIIITFSILNEGSLTSCLLLIFSFFRKFCGSCETIFESFIEKNQDILETWNFITIPPPPPPRAQH